MQVFQESGLIDNWTKNYTGRMPKFHLKPKQPTKVQMGDVFAAYRICAAMYSISLIVFILEIISVNCQRIKIILDYMTYWF